jgi:hypothetical protein
MLTVRVREGSVSQRRRYGGGGSRPSGVRERKCRLADVVARQRSEWVGETDIAHRGAEGMVYACCGQRVE